ncbi:MAG: acyltransferase [Vampirovibrionales bacterium]|nr:acyltransferase [Vampirovibrionales bacterium]
MTHPAISTSVQPSSAKARIQWLDGARGLAALGVMLLHFYHITLEHMAPLWLKHSVPAAAADTLGHTLSYIKPLIWHPYIQSVHPWILGHWDLGKIGVLLFFLISGYVIPLSLMKPAEHPIKAFALGRFFRLYPMYWASLALIGLLFFLGWNSGFPAGQWAANLTLLHKFVGIADINGVAWTLQIELIFYALCAVMAAFGQLNNPRWVLSLWAMSLLGGLAFAAAKNYLGIYAPVMLPMGLCYMWLGFLSRRLLAGSHYPVQAKSVVWGCFVGTLVLSAAATAWGYADKFGQYYASYVAALALYLLLSRFPVRPMAFWSWLGNISYSVYLIHAQIGTVFMGLIIAIRPAWFAEHWLALFALIAVAMALTLGISSLTYRWIEQPAVQLGRSLSERLFRKSPKIVQGLSS